MQDITCQKCGLINDYTVRKTELHQTAFCNGCSAYIKHLPKAKIEFTIYFGKFKNTKLKDFTSKEHVEWLKWAVRTCDLKQDLKDAIIKHLG